MATGDEQLRQNGLELDWLVQVNVIVTLELKVHEVTDWEFLQHYSDFVNNLPGFVHFQKKQKQLFE